MPLFCDHGELSIGNGEENLSFSWPDAVFKMLLQRYQADLFSCIKNSESEKYLYRREKRRPWLTAQLYSIPKNVYLLNRFLLVLHLSLKVVVFPHLSFYESFSNVKQIPKSEQILLTSFLIQVAASLDRWRQVSL